MMWAGLDTDAHATAAAQVWGSVCVNTMPESTKATIAGKSSPAKSPKSEPQQKKKATTDGGAVPCSKKEPSTRKREKGPETKSVTSNDTSSPESDTKNKKAEGKGDIASQDVKTSGPRGVACPQKSATPVTTTSEQDTISNVDKSSHTKSCKAQQSDVASKPCQSSGTGGVECPKEVAKTTADTPPSSDKGSSKKNCKLKPAATAAQDNKNSQSAHGCSSDVQAETKSQKPTAKDTLLCASMPWQAQTLSPELAKLEAATPEEIGQFPQVCSSFAHHLIHKVHVNESTTVQYVEKLQELFQEHHRSLKVMCSTDYARLAQGGRISVSVGAALREFDGFCKLWGQDEKTLMSVSATFWAELSTKHTTKDSSNSKRRKVATDADAKVKTNLCPQVTEVSKNAPATELSKNAQATEVSKNAQTIEVSKNAQATEVSKNAQATEVSKNAQATEVSKNAQATEVSKNAQVSTSTAGTLQTWYLVKQSLRLGMGLQTGAVYSEQELRNRCRDNAKKLAELEKCFKNNDLLTPISTPPIELRNQTAAASKTPPRKERDLSNQESAQKGVKHATSAKNAFFAAFAKGAENKTDAAEKSEGQTQPSEKAAEQNTTPCNRAVENADSKSDSSSVQSKNAEAPDSQKPLAKAGGKRKSSVTGSNAPEGFAAEKPSEGQTQPSEKIAEQSKSAEARNLQKPQAKASAKGKSSVTESNVPEGAAAETSSEGQTQSSEKVAEQSKSAEAHDLQKPQAKAGAKRKSSATESNVPEGAAAEKSSEGQTQSSEKVAEQSKSAEARDLQRPQAKAGTKRKSVSNAPEGSPATSASPPDEEIKQKPTTSTDADSSNSSNDVPKGKTKLSAKRTKTSPSTSTVKAH